MKNIIAHYPFSSVQNILRELPLEEPLTIAVPIYSIFDNIVSNQEEKILSYNTILNMYVKINIIDGKCIELHMKPHKIAGDQYNIKTIRELLNEFSSFPSAYKKSTVTFFFDCITTNKQLVLTDIYEDNNKYLYMMPNEIDTVDIIVPPDVYNVFRSYDSITYNDNVLVTTITSDHHYLHIINDVSDVIITRSEISSYTLKIKESLFDAAFVIPAIVGGDDGIDKSITIPIYKHSSWLLQVENDDTLQIVQQS